MTRTPIDEREETEREGYAFAAVVLADDPELTVSWTLRRTDSGETW